MSNQLRIMQALSGTQLSDFDISKKTGIPQASVRRTRLHLVAAGRVVAVEPFTDPVTWRVRQSWEFPNKYVGKQVL